jgi:tetratricopeptide (TPR) repeat protein
MNHAYARAVVAMLHVVAILHIVVWAGCGSGGNSEYDAAEAAYQAGDFQTAIEHFTQAAKTSDNPAIFANRGNCHSNLGDLDAALADYNTAHEKIVAATNDPNHPTLAYVYYNRGYAYERAVRYQEAIRDYERTIECNAQYPDVTNNLAWLLATCPDDKLRDASRAVTLAEAECAKSNWKDWTVLDTLAAAHAAAGDFAKAVQRQQEAVALAGDSPATQELQSRLDLYRGGQAYIESTTVKPPSP